MGKNILIYNWRDIKNPDAGGAEVFTHEIARRLVDKGHNITWFTAKFPGCQKEEVVDRIKIIRAGNRYTVYLKAREYYKKYFSKQSFDIVIDEINTIPFFTPYFVNNGEKIVVLIHQLAREFWFYETPLPAALLGRYILEDLWLKIYRDVPTMTVSESTKKDLIDLGFKNISIIPEGINFKPLDCVGEKEKDPTFIFVGRLKKAKLPDHAIKAFKLIKKEIPTAKLWVVGNGYYKKELEEMAGDGVTFFGSVDSKKKLELMSKAWAILVPGVREGWGLVVTEANAMGTPAIGYNVNGLRDSIRDLETGMLCDPNYESMAKKCIEFLGSDKEYMFRNDLRSASLFNWDISAEKLMEIVSKYE